MRFFKVLSLIVLTTLLNAQDFDLLQHIQLGDGEGEQDYSYKIDFFSNGDLLVAGQFEGFIDFDPDSTVRDMRISTENGGETYLVRYSPSGDLIWWRSIRSDRDIEAYGILVDNQDNFYVTGTYIEEAIFDESNPNAKLSGVSPNDGDAFIAKYNANGNYIWASPIAGFGIDAGFDLELNPAGEIVVLGTFGDSIYFDPNQSSTLRVSAGAGDVFFAGFNATNGQFQWVQTISGIGFDNPNSIEIDSQGNYYILGDYTSTLTFQLNPLETLVSSGSNDVFVARYDNNRQFEWAEKLAGSSTDVAHGMELANDTLLLITGVFRLSIQLDPSGTQNAFTGTNFNYDIFILALDTAANYQWAGTFGSTSADVVRGICIRNNSEVWLGGHFDGTVDFNTDPNQSFNLSASGGDGFLSGYQLNNGNFVNAYHMSGSAFSWVSDLESDPSSKIWTVGALFDQTNFNPSGTGYILSSPASGNGNSFFASYTTMAFDTAWVTEDGTGGNDYLGSAKFLSDGSILTCGTFEGMIDMDPGVGEHILRSRGDRDVFLARYNNQFQLLWAKRFGGPDFDEATAITEDPAGNVYVAGHYRDRFFYDGTNGPDSLVSGSLSSVFMAKLNPQGQLIWMNDIQGLGNEYAYGLSANPQGQVAIAGWMQFNISFDGVNTSSNVNNRAAYIAVYDTNSSFIWGEIIDGASNEYGYSCFASATGDFYLGGSYRNTVDFDPGSGVDSHTSNFGGQDAFFAKYSNSGQYQWVQVFGQNTFEAIYAFAEDDNQNLYVSGNFSATVDFDFSSAVQNLSSNGSDDVFVLSVDSSGSFRWATNLGGTGIDYPYDLAVRDSLVLSVGAFANTIDLDPGIDSLFAVSNGQDDIYLQVLDTSGNFVNGLSAGGFRQDLGMSVDHLNGETILGGHFQETADFDPDSIDEFNLRSSGLFDAFILKLGTPGLCPPLKDSIQTEACASYFWRGNTYQQSGVFTDTVIYSPACDSIYILNLTINQIEYDSLITQACDSYDWRGNTYFSSGLYYDTVSGLSPKCDSIYVLDLSLGTSNNYFYNINGCDSVVFRGITYFNGGYVVDTLQDVNGCDSIEEFFIYVESLDRTVISNGFTATASQNNVQYQWINCDSGTLVPNAITQNFDPSMYNAPNGNYAVELSSTNCTATSDCVFLQNIDLPEWSLASPLVYPNPSDGLLQIELPDADRYRFELYDAQGRQCKLKNGFAIQGKLEIELPQRSGLYYLRIENSLQEYWQESIIRR